MNLLSNSRVLFVQMRRSLDRGSPVNSYSGTDSLPSRHSQARESVNGQKAPFAILCEQGNWKFLLQCLNRSVYKYGFVVLITFYHFWNSGTSKDLAVARVRWCKHKNSCCKSCRQSCSWRWLLRSLTDIKNHFFFCVSRFPSLSLFLFGGFDKQRQIKKRSSKLEAWPRC